MGPNAQEAASAEKFWKHQLSNLNKVMLWMLCDDAVSDEAVTTPLSELISWLTHCRRVIRVDGDEKK